MEQQPLVSILMGVYQIEGLAQFPVMMESLLNQSYKKIEILICNDGSTDATGIILEGWAVRDVRIRILTHEKNQGLAAALNTCMRAVRGSLLARQDADDVSYPTRLAKQVAFLQEHKEIQFVGTNINLCDHRGVWGQRQLPVFPHREDFLFGSPFVHGSVMFRAQALHKADGYRVSRSTCRTEDYDLFMRMYALGMQGANLQENLYDYREDRENMAKRKYHYRVNEAIIRCQGFWKLGLLPQGILYVIKPLLVGLIPIRCLFWLKCRLHIFQKATGDPPCQT